MGSEDTACQSGTLSLSFRVTIRSLYPAYAWTQQGEGGQGAGRILVIKRLVSYTGQPRQVDRGGAGTTAEAHGFEIGRAHV